MPVLSPPTLAFGEIKNNTRAVTVAGRITFDAADVGKPFRLEIRLYGEDRGAEAHPARFLMGDDVLYTFEFHRGIVPRTYRAFTADAAGTVEYSERRMVRLQVLDEDPGFLVVKQHPPIVLPRPDEVYAGVTLTSAPVAARSPTVAA